MDDYAKSAFLWAVRLLEEEKERGICCAVLSVIEPKEKKRKLILRTEDVTEIFPPFAKTFDGFAWRYLGGELPYEKKATIGGYWFFPINRITPRKCLIHYLLSHSPL